MYLIWYEIIRIIDDITIINLNNKRVYSVLIYDEKLFISSNVVTMNKYVEYVEIVMYIV